MDRQVIQPTQESGLILATIPLFLSLSLNSMAATREATPIPWVRASVAVAGYLPEPATKIPSVAKSNGRSLAWASEKSVLVRWNP